jgi:large subunit ribosomal protein L2
VGSIICNNINLFEIRLGFRNSINNIPTGALISNITFKSKKTSILVRSAGTFGQILQKDSLYSVIKLPSGKTINVSAFESASIGRVSNILHNKRVVGKAGRNRNMGYRPSVRGIAMNPVDHPHGGRTNGGRPSVTPWGLPTKGVITVKK